MSTLKPKYDFKDVEQGRYQTWLDLGVFKANSPEKPPFAVVIPPPNVTGKLHLGHAWDNTLQDIIIRRKKMMGYDALFLPGMDHAGIATQAKVDARLKESGLSRYDLGREAFLDKAWAWKDEYAGHIKAQWAALGVFLDYDRERFTLDDDLNKAVNKVFITLFEKGLIYRGHRIINWDVEAKTALSNIEVEHQETEGKLYYFRYPLTDGSGHLVIATTRPETMFADQALMVHPEDPRYHDVVGKTVRIPGTNVMIPVIEDSYVDIEFGSGVVKVTPAHDPNDFEVGKRHGLQMPLCMEEDGTMNAMAFQYEGMARFVCRNALVKDLLDLGLVEKIEPYVNNVGYSERTGVVVEPRLSLQWFVDMSHLSKLALETSKARFVPSRFKKVFDNWMSDTQDWCISRQLWWGHRIPAWYKDDEVCVSVSSPGPGWTQDEDVLDTWFSSALWPFSTLGWPEETHDYKRFYPTDVLVTGYDIIFFWVARMIFQGLEFTKKDPFKDVLIHGLIRDKEGRKMSKSLGNGVDPMEVIDTYGVDALRYFLSTNSAPGADMRYEEEKVESSWNFINKLWNIARFILMNTTDTKTMSFEHMTLADTYITSRLGEVIKEADQNYEKYEFGEASRILYNFIWDEFASWYVECAKIQLQDEKTKETTQSVLRKVLSAVLRLMHPFMPFVTEKLYIELTDETSILTASWPTADEVNMDAINHFEDLKDAIVKVRNLRSEHDVAPTKPLDITLVIDNPDRLDVMTTQQSLFEKFMHARTLTFASVSEADETSILLAGKNINVFVKKKDIIDKEKERLTLMAQKTALEKELSRSRQILSNPSFLKKAPADKIKLEQEKEASYQKQYNAVIEALEDHV
ncbi:MAG: valine--tRNA ligase [Acholeplasmataceae bacterium]|nr:valine--tRNA ligase [Acholeplasmataceae bacterium]